MEPGHLRGGATPLAPFWPGESNNESIGRRVLYILEVSFILMSLIWCLVRSHQNHSASRFAKGVPIRFAYAGPRTLWLQRWVNSFMVNCKYETSENIFFCCIISPATSGVMYSRSQGLVKIYKKVRTCIDGWASISFLDVLARTCTK